MRRRLLIVYMSLFVLTLSALTVPFGMTLVARESQALFIAQQSDTVRFASLAASLPRGHSTRLRDDLARYRSLFGVDVAVVDQNGQVIMAARPSWTPRRKLIDSGLSGNRSESGLRLWPWTNDHLEVVEPVVRRGEVVGAVVTSGPAHRLRARLARQLSVVTLFCLVALVLVWLAVRFLTQWILVPVRELDKATQEVAAGRLEIRVASATGPPELRGLVRSFNAMADTVTRTLSRQRAFVSQASHQLRNPLGTLRLRVENLAEHLRPSGACEHELTLEEITRMVGTLDGLLALARLEERRPELVEVDADDLIDTRLASWRLLAGSHDVTLGRTGRIGAPVLCVRDGLDQVLDALLDNALKYGARTVIVNTRWSEGAAEITVRDDGPGLSAAERARALEKFWRGPSHQNIEGSGLGLPIVRMLVEISGGSLALLAGRPRGLHVQVRLPTRAASRPARLRGAGRGSSARPRDAARPDRSSTPGEN
ncbi:HAMP domain-containing histidine kinase [Spirillospora sp. NBC_00431]